jgi:pilus assembly protein TadC
MAVKAFEGIGRLYEKSGMPVGPFAFAVALLVLATASAIAAASASAILVPTQFGDNGLAVGIVVFLAILSLFFALPISMRDERVQAIDDNLPDALKHVAIVLKAGGTLESALGEAARNDYGPLSEELSQALDRMRKGKTFEEAMHDAALSSGSKLFLRVATIVSDAKRAGAGVADVMTAIADDARDVTRIRRERATRTTMHVVFLNASALILAPFIFGFTLNIVSFVGAGISCSLGPVTAITSLVFLNSLLAVFLAVLAAIVAVATGIVREGNGWAYAARAPLMVLIALAVFEFGKAAGFALLGGSVAGCG